VFDERSAAPAAALRDAEPGSLPSVIGVHQAASLQPAGRPRAPKTASRVRGQRASQVLPTRRCGGARCGWPSAQPWLHAGVRGLPTRRRVDPPDARTEQCPGSQRRGPRWRHRFLHPKTLQADRFTGTSHGDGEHKNMGGPCAASRHGRSQARLANLCSRPKRVGVRGHSRACARAASPCPARCGRLVASGAARSEAATHPPIPAQATTA
jgi:hypothetical protein